MSRVNNLLDFHVEEKLKSITSSIEEIKTEQRLGGDSITPIVFEFDQFITPSSDGFGNYYVEVYCEFIANTQLNPYIRPQYKFYDMSENEVVPGNLDTFVVSNITGSIWFTGSNLPNYDDNKAYSYIAYEDTTPYKVKIILYASDHGTFNGSVNPFG